MREGLSGGSPVQNWYRAASQSIADMMSIGPQNL
jgi:hypothetical protein